MVPKVGIHGLFPVAHVALFDSVRNQRTVQVVNDLYLDRSRHHAAEHGRTRSEAAQAKSSIVLHEFACGRFCDRMVALI